LQETWKGPVACDHHFSYLPLLFILASPPPTHTPVHAPSSDYLLRFCWNSLPRIGISLSYIIPVKQFKLLQLCLTLFCCKLTPASFHHHLFFSLQSQCRSKLGCSTPASTEQILRLFPISSTLTSKWLASVSLSSASNQPFLFGTFHILNCMLARCA
jgi:hypothetical protein